MKKYITVAALLAAGSVFANAVEISPLTDSQTGTWVHANNNAIDGNGVLSGDPNWQVDCSTYTLATSLTISVDEILNFSFDATNNGTGNSCLTLALIGSSNAIVVGHGTYDKPGDELQVAVTDNTGAQGYVFANTNAKDDVQLTAGATLSSAMPTGGAISTISGQIKWDGDSWSLTTTSTAVDSSLNYDLGITSLEVSKLVVTIEGGHGPDDASDEWKTPTMSNLKISVIPEPSTFGLLAGLGALALVASRRRRR
ncbi:PEP-CTERM sorting domain-containing protein [Candidatus Spyradosoma sp. SGI.093]|uniref:PEP-CTERM sorting domain-containing protein n=1 Tax=Candidatus Spyradosoma sp. SGI.093 TaxID=3420583 RepID=UPI003D08FE45